MSEKKDEQFTINIERDKITDGSQHGYKQVRTEYDKPRLKELAQDIKDRGLRNPIQVWQHESGDYIRVGGGRRMAAIEMLVAGKEVPAAAFKTLPCKVVPAKDGRDALVEAGADNIHRVNMTSFEEAEMCARLKNEGDAQKEIATRLHKSEAWVSRALQAYLGAIPAARKAWSADKLTIENVQDLVRNNPDPEKQAPALEELLAERSKGNKGAARKKVKKGKKDKDSGSDWASKTDINMVLGNVVGAKSAYVKGMHDALLYVKGELGSQDFDEPYFAHLKAMKEKAKADAEKAKVEEKKVREEDATEKARKKAEKAAEKAA